MKPIPISSRLKAVSATLTLSACLFAVPSLAAASPPRAGAAAPCATAHVKATPKVNAQNAPYETVTSTVASCSSAVETVVLTQHLSGPFGPHATAARTWTLTLAPGQSAAVVRRIPYSCCGTYYVRDRVTAGSQLLAHASTSFTFA